MRRFQSSLLSLENFLVYLLIGPSIFLYHFLDRAKFIYFIPAIFFGYLLFSGYLVKEKTRLKQLFLDQNVLSGLVLYILVVILSIFFSDKIFDQSVILRDILIIASPLVVFLPRMEFDINHVYYLFICWLFAYVTWVGVEILNWKGSLNFITSNFNEKTEFHNGVVFGLFFLTFLFRRKYLLVLFSLFVIILTGKRSIFLGLLPALFALPITYLMFREKLNSIYLMGFLLLAFSVFFAIGVHLVEVSGYFLSIADSDGTASVEKFLMGRDVYILALKSEFYNSSLGSKIFGHGPGQADSFLWEFVKPDWTDKVKYVNPHNDYLKILYDYGVVGALVIFFIMYAMYINSRIGVAIFFYTLGVFFVDNSLIFIYYTLTACVLARMPSISSKSPRKSLKVV